MQIESTTDYEVFKCNERNRRLDRANLAAIEQSIRNKNLLHERPILIDKDFYIIDGQHRLEVAKALDLPIYFIISENVELKDMIALNNCQKGWNIANYLNYYVMVGEEEYIKLNDFIKKSGIQINIAIKLLNGNRSLNFFKNFREGRYKFPTKEEYEEAENKNFLIKDVIEFIKKKTSGPKIYLGRVTFYGALVDFFNCKSFNYETFKKKLHYKLDFLRPCTKQCEYVRIFKEIYNWKNQSPISETEFTELVH